MSAACKYCGLPITWITTAAGGRIPLDAKPLHLYVELRPKMWQRTFCYQSHLDTCPKGKESGLRDNQSKSLGPDDDTAVLTPGPYGGPSWTR